MMGESESPPQSHESLPQKGKVGLLCGFGLFRRPSFLSLLLLLFVVQLAGFLGRPTIP